LAGLGILPAMVLGHAALSDSLTRRGELKLDGRDEISGESDLCHVLVTLLGGGGGRSGEVSAICREVIGDADQIVRVVLADKYVEQLGGVVELAAAVGRDGRGAGGACIRHWCSPRWWWWVLLPGWRRV